jgi:hypothetical protein
MFVVIAKLKNTHTNIYSNRIIFGYISLKASSCSYGNCSK